MKEYFVMLFFGAAASVAFALLCSSDFSKMIEKIVPVSDYHLLKKVRKHPDYKAYKKKALLKTVLFCILLYSVVYTAAYFILSDAEKATVIGLIFGVISGIVVKLLEDRKGKEVIARIESKEKKQSLKN